MIRRARSPSRPSANKGSALAANQGSALAATEGSALVETAFLLPILVVIFAGVAELSRALYSHHALAKATRDAGRFLSRVADPEDAGFQAMAVNYVRTGSYAGASGSLVGTDPSKIGVTVTVADIDNSGGAYYGGAVIQAITVQATYSFESPLLSAFKLIDGAAIPLSASHVERHIGS